MSSGHRESGPTQARGLGDSHPADRGPDREHAPGLLLRQASHHCQPKVRGDLQWVGLPVNCHVHLQAEEGRQVPVSTVPGEDAAQHRGGQRVHLG